MVQWIIRMIRIIRINSRSMILTTTTTHIRALRKEIEPACQSFGPVQTYYSQSGRSQGLAGGKRDHWKASAFCLFLCVLVFLLHLFICCMCLFGCVLIQFEKKSFVCHICLFVFLLLWPNLPLRCYNLRRRTLATPKVGKGLPLDQHLHIVPFHQ